MRRLYQKIFLSFFLVAFVFLLLYGVYGPRFRRHCPDCKPPRTVGQGNFEGIVTGLLRRHEEHVGNPSRRQETESCSERIRAGARPSTRR